MPDRFAEMRRELERMSIAWSKVVDSCSGKPTKEQWDLIHKSMKKDVGKIVDKHSIRILRVVQTGYSEDITEDGLYEEGRRDGYDEGFSDGRDDGYSSGLTAGRDGMLLRVRAYSEELKDVKQQLDELRASKADE